MFKQGIKIRQLRERKGLKQIEMADAIDVSQSWLSKVESGFISPDYETLEKIARFLEVTTAELLSSELVIETQNNYDHSNGVYFESENHILREYIEKLEKLNSQQEFLINSLIEKLNLK